MVFPSQNFNYLVWFLNHVYGIHFAYISSLLFKWRMRMNLVHMFIEGGFIMWPLLAFSIVIWIIFAEKLWYLRRFKSQSLKLDNELNSLLAKNDIESISKVLEKYPSVISKPYMAVISQIENKSNETKDEFNTRVSRRVKETQTNLKRYLWMLGTIASSAPFVGLFGTVVGIIKSFDSIAEAGKGGFAIVAAGLSEALIATAAGIIVAVIAVIFFNYFQTKLSVLNEEFRHRLEDFNDYLSQRMNNGL